MNPTLVRYFEPAVKLLNLNEKSDTVTFSREEITFLRRIYPFWPMSWKEKNVANMIGLNPLLIRRAINARDLETLSTPRISKVRRLIAGCTEREGIISLQGILTIQFGETTTQNSLNDFLSRMNMQESTVILAAPRELESDDEVLLYLQSAALPKNQREDATWQMVRMDRKVMASFYELTFKEITLDEFERRHPRAFEKFKALSKADKNEEVSRAIMYHCCIAAVENKNLPPYEDYPIEYKKLVAISNFYGHDISSFRSGPFLEARKARLQQIASNAKLSNEDSDIGLQSSSVSAGVLGKKMSCVNCKGDDGIMPFPCGYKECGICRNCQGTVYTCNHSVQAGRVGNEVVE